MRNEPVGINPRVDVAFRYLLGDPRHVDILLAFLNAAMSPIVLQEVVIENPISHAASPDDKAIVVDVRAMDTEGRTYQIEMQTLLHPALGARMLYGPVTLYQQQLAAGDSYVQLKPVVSIWLLGKSFWQTASWRHHFELVDRYSDARLPDHLTIMAFELTKVPRPDAVGHGQTLEAWMCFFADAENWDHVPENLSTPALESAMGVLNEIKNSAEVRAIYNARQDFLHLERTKEEARERAERELAQERAAKEQALAAKEQALAAKEQALAAKEQERAAKEQALAAKEQERAAKEQALAEVVRLKRLLGSED